jgi:hypothetical protein
MLRFARKATEHQRPATTNPAGAVPLGAAAVSRFHILPMPDPTMVACAVLEIAAGAELHPSVDHPIQTVLRRVGRPLFRPPPLNPALQSRTLLAAGSGICPQW